MGKGRQSSSLVWALIRQDPCSRGVCCGHHVPEGDHHESRITCVHSVSANTQGGGEREGRGGEGLSAVCVPFCVCCQMLLSQPSFLYITHTCKKKKKHTHIQP